MYTKQLVILVISCFSLTALGQEEPDFYSGEVSKMVNIPNSPEAAAFAKYGDTQVSMFTGVPQISQALHTIEGREMSVPISLTYDASGIPVEQQASWVGLSWNLNAGGRISRTVNGLPDDYISSPQSYKTVFNDNATAIEAANYINRLMTDSHANLTFDTAADAKRYAEFLYLINTNYVETQADYFSLNVMGLNETIVFEKVNGVNVPRVMNNPRIKVEPYLSIAAPLNITGWKITGEDGTQYFFEEIEETTRTNANDAIAEDGSSDNLLGDVGDTVFASSWLLTKVISKNSKDTFEFDYKQDGTSDNLAFASAAGSGTTELLPNVTNYTQIPMGKFSAVTTAVKQKFMTGIDHNGATLATFNFGNRYDVTTSTVNSRLASIDFFDDAGNGLKKVVLDNNDYFNLDGQVPGSGGFNKDYYDIRLKLNSYTIKGTDNNSYETFAFEYYVPDNLPSRSSFDQDYYGYYNAAGNSTLFPFYQTDNLTFAGADREPNSAAMRIGMLEKVTYPTKGHTIYEYESHDVNKLVPSPFSIAPLNLEINEFSLTTPELNKDEDGNLCDDRFAPPLDPKMKIDNFTILATGAGVYDLIYTATSSEALAIIVKLDENSPPFQNYCDFQNIGSNESRFLYASETSTMTLTEGNYAAIIVVGPDGATNEYGNSSLRLIKTSNAQIYQNISVGGNRIATITDYTKANEMAQQKQYTYNDGESKSTGTVNYPINLIDGRSGTTQNGNKGQLVRQATFARGTEPYISYCLVSETRTNGGQNIGSTTYEYYPGSQGTAPRVTAPYENMFIPSLRAGNVMKKTIKNAANDTVAQEEIDYYETTDRPIKIRSLVVSSEEEYFGKTVLIQGFDKGTPDEYYKLVYLDNWDCNPPSPEQGCVPPPYVVNPIAEGYEEILSRAWSPFKATTTFANGAYGGINYSKTETAYPEGTVTSIEETTYDESPGSLYLPKKKTITDSKGEVYETTYRYATDENITSLINKNCLTEVVKTETVKLADGQLISSRENGYGTFGAAVLPTVVKTKKGSSAQEDRVTFDFYQNGNLRMAKQENGPTTVYLWGYDDRYPIAKIEGATKAEVATALITNEAGLATFDETNITAIDALRSNGTLSQAMITTYTYKPLVGVATITDPRGYTNNFEYDARNRLKTVKDDAGKLVSDYQYHFKDQQ